MAFTLAANNGYMCPSCLSLLREDGKEFCCLECRQVFRVKDGVVNFSNSSILTADSILSSEEIGHLYREVKSVGWYIGITRFLSNIPLEKFVLISHIIGVEQVGWKFICDLSGPKRVLIFDTTLGTVTESLAPYCKEIYVTNPDQRMLECIGKRLEEKGINNINLIQYSDMNHLPFQEGLFELIILHNVENIFLFSGNDSIRLAGLSNNIAN